MTSQHWQKLFWGGGILIWESLSLCFFLTNSIQLSLSRLCVALLARNRVYVCGGGDRILNGKLLRIYTLILRNFFFIFYSLIALMSRREKKWLAALGEMGVRK